MKIRTLLLSVLCTLGVGALSQNYSTQALLSDTKFFTDWSCTQLHENFRSKNLKEFQSPLMQQLASRLLSGTYNDSYIVQNYKAVPSDKVLQETLKLKDGYSRYENMTGVYLEQGENVVLTGDFYGRTVSLLVPDWNRQPTPGFAPTKDPEGWGVKFQEISLKEGVNVIHVKKAGNVYINYFADDPEQAPKIAIHFPTGKANGYFDVAVHDNEDWKRLLDNAVSPMMDVKGKYIQLVYPVEYLKQFAYDKGVELTENYDKIMYRQYEFMGAVKYDRIPDKRILARVNYNYYMFRDGDGVAFLGNENTMKMAIGPEVTTNWGVNHEIGHVMQMKPQMTWGGMMEVSNNLFSMYATKALGAPSRLSDRKIYEAAFKGLQDKEEKEFVMLIKDPFHKLVPFWQLQVYCEEQGYTDFYADMMEHMRQNPHKGIKDESIHNMYEFMKLCCDLAKTDFTEFFDHWGFFEVGHYSIKDYGVYNFDITSETVEEVKKYIAGKNYPKPAREITCLTD